MVTEVSQSEKNPKRHLSVKIRVYPCLSVAQKNIATEEHGWPRKSVRARRIPLGSYPWQKISIRGDTMLARGVAVASLPRIVFRLVDDAVVDEGHDVLVDRQFRRQQLDPANFRVFQVVPQVEVLVALLL